MIILLLILNASKQKNPPKISAQHTLLSFIKIGEALLKGYLKLQLESR